MLSIRVLVHGAIITASLAQGQLPTMPAIPSRLPASIRQPLVAKRQTLAESKLALMEAAKMINQSCARVVTDSPEHRACLVRGKEYNDRVAALSTAMHSLGDDIDAAIRSHTIGTMESAARRLGWRAAERARLDTALRSLAADGDSTATDAAITAAWRDILARGESAEFSREAAGGVGPGYYDVGTQAGHRDCTIFSLASAAGVPYGVVAARAGRLIREGEWREADDRGHPQSVIETKGLIGGEVIMLAEAFGQVHVVASSAFPTTLRSGSPILVTIVPRGLDGAHQVVLTKSFQHRGDTWYEMVDSNQGSQHRSYLSADELDTLLLERGISFHAEPGTTPRLLH